jgi:hypothetical protein
LEVQLGVAVDHHFGLLQHKLGDDELAVAMPS